MKDVYDYAKFFLKNGADATPNTYDGNMKLQKLLALADMIHIAKYDTPLFKEDVLAFKDGYVIEKVRKRYRYDYKGFKTDSDKFEPDFTDEEYDVLNTALGLYSSASARELSNLSHTFKSWQETFDKATAANGYHDKAKSVVNFSDYPEDIEMIKKALSGYEKTKDDCDKAEVINGVTFYYDGITLTDEVMAELEEFSRVCDEDIYTVYADDGKLVIY